MEFRRTNPRHLQADDPSRRIVGPSPAQALPAAYRPSNQGDRDVPRNQFSPAPLLWRGRRNHGRRPVRHDRIGERRGKGRASAAACDQAGRAYLVRCAEADRCGRSEHRICRSRSRRRSRGHALARLALRHLQLCRCDAVAGLGGLPRDRALSARLRHDAHSFRRNGPQRPAVGARRRYHCTDGRAEDREGNPRRV